MEMYFVLFGCFAVPVLVCTMKKGRQCYPASSVMKAGLSVLRKMTTLTAIMLEAFAKGAALAVSVFLLWKQNTEEG